MTLELHPACRMRFQYCSRAVFHAFGYVPLFLMPLLSTSLQYNLGKRCRRVVLISRLVRTYPRAQIFQERSDGTRPSPPQVMPRDEVKSSNDFGRSVTVIFGSLILPIENNCPSKITSKFRRFVSADENKASFDNLDPRPSKFKLFLAACALAPKI